MRRWSTVVALAIGLPGCAVPLITDPVERKAVMDRDLPTDYKAQVLEHAKYELRDVKVRVAGLSEPQVISFSAIVCVQAKADNILNINKGWAHIGFEFKDRKLYRTDWRALPCTDALNYQPIPELLYKE